MLRVKAVTVGIIILSETRERETRERETRERERYYREGD